MQLDTILIFIFSVSILTMSPGPDIIYVFLKSSTDGLKAGIKTVFGLTTGLIFHTFLLVFGISALIKNSEHFFFILKLFGFCYFLFLSISIFFKTKKTRSFSLVKTRNDFFVGLMMNLLNPKVSLFFIALFPGFMFSDNISIEIQFLVLGLIFWFIATLIFLIIVFISSRLKNKIQNLIENNNVMYLQSIVFLLIAVWIIK